MDIRFERNARITWILIGILFFCGCSSSSNAIPVEATIQIPPSAGPAPISTRQPGPWQLIGVYDADQNIMTAGFLNEQVVATGGVVGEMGYSSDGAQTWLVTDAKSDCRYGMDIVNPDLIWTCGGMTHVRRSVDGGKIWQALTAFGDPRTITNPCHSASFLDENIGWLANSNLFGTTTDGGVTWSMRALPETADKVATIDTYKQGEGYLLDQSGVLFFTQDDGQHWSGVGRLELGAYKMPMSVYQLAAMRFADADHGLIVFSSSPYGTIEPVTAFHTSDGGQTWTSELVPVLAGPVYLARADGYLTVITAVNQLTLLKYGE